MLSNLVGKNSRRQTLPPRQDSTTTSTAKSDPASVRRRPSGAHSRSNSIDVSPPPAGASPYGNPQLSSSQSSLASTKAKKGPLLRRALTKVVQPSSSNGSLKDAANGKQHTNGSVDLSSELAVTQQKLAEATNQCTTLQDRISLLEKSSQEHESQTQQAQEAAIEERTKLVQSHLAEMETQRKETEELRRSLEDFIRKSIEMEERVEVLTRGVGNVEVQLKERDELIHELRAAEGSMADALHHLETTVQEKDRTIEDLERRNGAFSEKSELLQKQVREMEGRLKDQYRSGPMEGDGFFSSLWKWFSGPH